MSEKICTSFYQRKIKDDKGRERIITENVEFFFQPILDLGTQMKGILTIKDTHCRLSSQYNSMQPHHNPTLWSEYENLVCIQKRLMDSTGHILESFLERMKPSRRRS